MGPLQFGRNFKVAGAGVARHHRHPGWPEQSQPVRLNDGEELLLRPIMRRDGASWRSLRLANQPVLQPVEPTVLGTWEDAHSSEAWRLTFGYLRSSANQGNLVPLVIELAGQFVGQLTLGNIQRGAVSEAWIGYWVDQEVSGRGVAKAAVALGIDLAFERVGLHRLTATYLPNNPASGAVLAANGFQQEGVLRRSLHIDGDWQDHVYMALLEDDFATGAVARLRQRGAIQ
ncbi:GNAT family protein [Corynebacterium sp. H127]|uniref:GNAT family N-acetyltransferase n=1 Tax=Corynebacterium sp. H127 TaxID=3133418 RepID=UPI0030A3F35F